MNYRKLTHRFYSLFFTVATTCLVAHAVPAQSDTGKVVGTLKDTNGSVVSGARVKARDLNGLTNREAVSSDVGTFELPALPIGKYEISAEAPGFKTYWFVSLMTLEPFDSME